VIIRCGRGGKLGLFNNERWWEGCPAASVCLCVIGLPLLLADMRQWRWDAVDGLFNKRRRAERGVWLRVQFSDETIMSQSMLVL
jgi:hypothetical protein